MHSQPIQIVRSGPELEKPTFELLFRHLDSVQAVKALDSLCPLAERGIDVLAGLVSALEGNRLVGSCWLQPLEGRTASLWEPQTVEKQSASLRLDLARAALEAGNDLPVELVQSMVDIKESTFADELLELGFTQLADLLYMSLEVRKGWFAPKRDPALVLVPNAADDPAQLGQMLIRTYEATLDCPGLDGLRNVADTIAGYQSSGSFQSNLWFFVLWEGELVGTLLLTPYPECRQWELVYMGIVPECRGKGVGGKVLLELHRLAHASNIDHVVLAVDEANWPARRIYQRAGFREWARRTAFIRLNRHLGSDLRR